MCRTILCSDEFCICEAKWLVATPMRLLYLCDEHVRKYRDIHDKLGGIVNFSVGSIKDFMPNEEVINE